MCGIAGILPFDGLFDKKKLNEMVSSIAHRGPDQKNNRLSDRDYVPCRYHHQKYYVWLPSYRVVGIKKNGWARHDMRLSPSMLSGYYDWDQKEY